MGQLRSKRHNDILCSKWLHYGLLDKERKKKLITWR